MTEHYTRDHVRKHSHIWIPITTSTNGESLSITVLNVINQFILGSKLIDVTIDDGTNLERFKSILESNFDNTGVFDLGNPMFVMECLAHVLTNLCKEG